MGIIEFLTIFFIVSFVSIGILKLIVYICAANSIYIMTFICGAITMLFFKTVFMYFKENKKKNILEKAFGDVAKKHYRDKYNENINVFEVKLFSDQYFFAKKYTGSGIVYLDKKMLKRVTIFLNSKFELEGISDNFNDVNLRELEDRLKTVLKKSDILES